MAVPAIPVVIVLLCVGAYCKRDKTRGVMTPERTKVFNAALAGGMLEPDNLDKLAKTFEDQGLREQGQLLRQRAQMRRLPNEVKLARRAVWRRAIESQNKPAMQRIAAAYDQEGCTAAAMRLREIISGLPSNVPAPDPQISGEAESAPVEETPTETQPEDTDEGEPEDQQAAE